MRLTDEKIQTEYRRFLDIERIRPVDARADAGSTLVLLGLRDTVHAIDVSLSQVDYERLTMAYELSITQVEDMHYRAVWSEQLNIQPDPMRAKFEIINGVCVTHPAEILTLQSVDGEPLTQSDIAQLEDYINHAGV